MMFLSALSVRVVPCHLHYPVSNECKLVVSWKNENLALWDKTNYISYLNHVCWT